MYEQIMVPTDGSGFDREAILVALRIAECCGAKVRLVRVLTTGAYVGVGASGIAGSMEAAIPTVEVVRAQRDAALSELYALAAECRSLTSADVTVDLEQGPAADVLEGYAKRNEVDLIVISSHGRRGLARMALGSVTDSLIRGTTIPVLVIKPKASYLTPEASKDFHHIVVPLDGSSLAEQILTRIVPFAKLENAGVTLLHVLTPSKDSYESEDGELHLPWWEKRLAGAQAYLSRKAAEIRVKGVSAGIDVVIGEQVPEAITEYARRERADLIAIATHGRGGLARVLRGSVATEVTKSAMSSILVFHPDRGAEKDIAKPRVEEEREKAVALA